MRRIPAFRGLFGPQRAAGPSGPPRANPSITVTQQGVDAVVGVKEQFTVSGGTDEVVTFADGVEPGGDVTFDAGGNVTGANAPNLYGFAGGGGTPTASFDASSEGGMPDMAKTSGGGGTVTVTQQGVTPIAGVSETLELDMDEAIAGTFRITNGTLTTAPIAAGADAAAIEAELESTFSLGFAATLVGENFVITYDDAGTRVDLTITQNLLTK
jgi:hypothetical protein